MSCCEDRAAVQRATMAHPSWHGRAVLIRYAGARMVAVRGPRTRRVYTFSGTAREQPVDPRDAAALLGSAWFRVVGVVRIETTAVDDTSVSPN